MAADKPDWIDRAAAQIAPMIPYGSPGDSVEVVSDVIRREWEPAKAALKQLGTDGHVYGSRPCETCAKITELLGEPFGCDRWRDRMARLGRAQ